MNRKQLNFYKQLLERQRAEILWQFAHQHRDYRETAESAADLFDRASIDGSKEFAAILANEDHQRWFEITNALSKIESGDYGFCEECGQPINEKRLQAMPTAALCFDCQRHFEQRQAHTPLRAESDAGAMRISEEKWEESYWGD